MEKLKRENKQIKSEANKMNEKNKSKINELQTDLGNAQTDIECL